jgi:hypothetical protein
MLYKNDNGTSLYWPRRMMLIILDYQYIRVGVRWGWVEMTVNLVVSVSGAILVLMIELYLLVYVTKIILAYFV